jgi:chromate transporter
MPTTSNSRPARTTAANPAPGLGEATALWLRIGCLSFGGAATQIGMLHRAVVEERGWVSERRFLDALSYCTLLPGPEAQQLATYLGYILHGVRGGVVAGLLFVIPGALVMLALCLLYVLGSNLALVQGLFFGVKAAVIAIVAQALWKIGGKALKTPLLVATAVVTFLAIVLLDIGFIAIVLGAALLGFGLAMVRPDLLGLAGAGQATAQAEPSVGTVRGALIAAGVWTVVWWAPVALAALTLGGSHLLVDVGLFFSKLAMVTFGGAYAVLAYLADAAVTDKGWLSATEMIDGLGLAETTPGPTILVNQFAAFLAGWRAPEPFGPVVMAALASAMAVWVTFAPSFVWIFAGAPFVERVRGDKRLSGALAMITAAVVGVIAALVLTFGLKVLFAQVGSMAMGPITFPAPTLASFSPLSAALAAAAAVMLFVLKRGVIETVLAAAAAGVVVTLVGKLIG